ncbi:MAG: hypothetical protein K2G96_03955, partial [Clostridia bacterium]|nr:hypothetical protein [Clostridia bacterium]
QCIEYVLKLFENLSEPEQKYLTVKENLELKRQEILDSLPTAPEPVYIINYCIANGLSFSDIDFVNNIVEYRNSDGVIELASAHSQKATDEGYIFKGWLMNGQPVKTLENLSGDVTLFADFELTPTVNIIFKNYEDSSELLTLENLPRTGSYDFDAEKIKERIYAETQLLPVAYFSDKTRIYSADLSIGKIVTVNVLIAAAREVHLSDSGNVSVGWTYEFEISGEKLLTSALTEVGTVFVVPIGATVILTAMHANISDILVDGVSKGEKLNNSLVRAEFQLSDGEYPASVTLKTVLSEMTTLSFVGYNQHSVVYPLNWDGRIAEVDLERIYFIFDEGNEHYQVSYIIDGKTYYFEDLEKYEFKGDTQIKVNRVRNSFSFTVVYLNGTEKIEGITGKQTLRSAFEKLDPEALEIVNTIISESRLYSDKIAGATIATEELFATVLRKDIVFYSDWERPAVKPQEPEFGDVDYSAYGFVKEWSSLFTDDGNILSSDFVLTQDGLYTYKTFVNGNLSADISGVYRIENGQIVLKTFNLNYEYQLVDLDDLFVDIEFADDGLIRASFIELQGTSLTVFEHTLFSGNVRPANYTNREFLGLYELDVIKIELKANGTAAINYQSESYELYYRVNEDGRLYVFNNGVFGTGELVGLFGGNENENR